MSALSFLIIVAALAGGSAFLSAAILYPLWATASTARPGLARGTVVIAALPWLVAVGVGLAALLPGDPHLAQFLSCHCHTSVQGWIHLCPVHPGNALAALPVSAAVLALLTPGRLSAIWSVLRQPLGRGGDVVVTELPAPTAVLVGWLRPTLAIDDRLWDDLDVQERQALLAHERAHLQRRDPLVLQGLKALGVLAPRWSTSRLIRSWLHRAETRADAAAANELGDPLLLASALLRCARLGLRSESAVLGWTGGDLTRRVERLMDTPTGPAGAAVPDAGIADGVLLAAVGLLVAASSPWVHHELEHLLNLSL